MLTGVFLFLVSYEQSFLLSLFFIVFYLYKSMLGQKEQCYDWPSQNDACFLRFCRFFEEILYIYSEGKLSPFFDTQN